MLAEAALGDGDAAARTQLLNSLETLPEVREQVRRGTGADMQALARANQAIDTAEQQARQEALDVSQRVTDAVKQSFATSITRIYVYAIVLAIIALIVVAAWLPELPLSRSTRNDAQPAVE